MAEARPTLYLVDGSGYVFRAFHALPQLNNSRGLPTNAAYGFTRMLVKLIKDARPTHLAIVFDSAKRTFRDDLFADYKANRPSAPNDLRVQIPYIHKIVEAFRIKSLIIDGYEADDVIGTLALRASRQRMNTVIVTADKDFMQLVSPNISLWDTMRDKRTGTREVRERFGVEPRAVVDIMALTGDPIDNIKSVPGVGEKTAAALIAKFTSLDNLMAHLDEVESSGIRGGKKFAVLLEQHRADIALARKLVRIDTDMPLEAEVSTFNYEGIDQAAAAELMRELEFTSLLKELTPGQASLPLSAAVETVAESADVAAIAEQLSAAPEVAMHFCADAAGGEVLKLKAEGQDEIYVLAAGSAGDLRSLLEGPTPPKACHDLKGQLAKARALGIELRGLSFDGMLAGFLINPGKPEPSLEDLYHDYVAPLGSHLNGSEPEVILALSRVLRPRLEQDGLHSLFFDIELPLAIVLSEMEVAGIGIDSDALRGMSTEFSLQLYRLEQECCQLAGRKFNLNSPIQLRDVLFTELKLPTKGLKRTKSGFSTDVDVLTKLAELHPLPKKLLEYRNLSKLKSTYIDSLPALIDQRSGRLHTQFHQATTATGRLSSTDPNLQNIPTRTEEGRRIRRAFVAKPGSVLLSADYSQIELRILAHLSADSTLIDAFARDQDIHIRTATEVLGLQPDAVDAEARRLAKVINFGIIYGMGPQRLSNELQIPLADAGQYIRRYFERLPGVSSYMESCLEAARKQGFVTTMFGRRRYLPELNSPQGGARAQAERIAINTPIQGSAADLIKIAMVRLHRLLQKSTAQMLLQVHDELLFEVATPALDQVCAIVKREMEDVAALRVPLKVDLRIGPNWAELRS